MTRSRPASGRRTTALKESCRASTWSARAPQRNGRQNIALSISLISLLITGIDVAAIVGTAYARAFQVSPPRGAQKYLRGGA